MLSDIVEKDVNSHAEAPAPAPPSAPVTGFPIPKIRSQFKKSRKKTEEPVAGTSAIANAASAVHDQSIDAENRNLIAKMSKEEILQEQEDIEEKLGAKMVEFLRKRAAKKETIDEQPIGDVYGQQMLERKQEDAGKEEFREGAAKVQRKSVRIQEKQPADDHQPDSTQRIIREKYFPDAKYNEDQHSWLTSLPPPSEESKGDTLRFDFHGNLMTGKKEAYLEGMHHHGLDQGSPGYTVDEFLMLSGSTNISQRILSLRSLSHILLKWYKREYTDETVQKLDYVQLGKAILSFRFAMSESNKSVVVAGLSGIASIVLEELHLDKHLNNGLTHAESASSTLKVYSGQLNLQPSEMKELLSTPLAFLTFRTDLADTLNDLLKGTAVIAGDNSEIKKVANIIFALSKHSIKTASECVNTPLFIERIVKTFIEKDWPSDEKPDSLAISALSAIAAASRSNASAIRSGKAVDVASRYLTIPPFKTSRKDAWFLAIESLVLMRTMANYGIVQGVSAVELISGDCIRWLSNQKEELPSHSSAFISALFETLEMWTICAIDPHHTSPHHIIVWTQVESFIDMALAALQGVMDELTLASVWSYLSIWLRGNKGVADKAKWLEEYINIEDTKKTFDHHSQTAINLLAQDDYENAASSLCIVNATTRLLSHSGPYNLPKELIDVLLNTVTETNTATYNKLRPGLDALCRSILQSNLDNTENIHTALQLLTVLREGDESIVVAVLSHLLQNASPQVISTVTGFPEREAKASKETTVPLLIETAKLMLVDGIYSGISIHSNHLSQISTLTIPFDANTLLYENWALKITLDELSQSANSEALKNLPAHWNYSEVDLVMGGLTLQETINKIMGTSCSKQLLQLMRIFLLELGVEGGEVFRNERVQIALERTLHKVLTGLENDKYTLEDAQEEARADIPFYQIYTDYVGLFESISLGDRNTAIMLFPPLLLAQEYRRLLWVDHAACVKSIKLTWTDFPKWFVNKLLFPLEHNVDVIRAYARAISTKSLVLNIQPLAYWIALHHSSLCLWHTQDEALRRDLIVALLSTHPETAKMVIQYDNDEHNLKLPGQAKASPEIIQRRLDCLKDNDETLLSAKLGSILSIQ
ncbi:hypothetical protein E3Q23_01597 [Wallemia mellicola]|uniref:RNA polymerase II-associated protein 1 C-terminal domain-containing protein n=1 Tax=Wallemia mellicola TaxID=1708541 RepID=A0A4T0TNC6_9BASI|nr:hypothetical protein E3Q23_01597 [Wallemia mellicola]TIC66511.1 hypothetical protein E3Q01_01692 [Wallemia mellicola]